MTVVPCLMREMLINKSFASGRPCGGVGRLGLHGGPRCRDDNQQQGDPPYGQPVPACAGEGPPRPDLRPAEQLLEASSGCRTGLERERQPECQESQDTADRHQYARRKTGRDGHRTLFLGTGRSCTQGRKAAEVLAVAELDE
jgi:hypothetical protein